MRLSDAIANLKTEMKYAGIEQEEGLGTELFHFSSTLAPVVNVDLLITDEKNRVLLSWRADDYTETGWHVPGSCIRFQETIQKAIQRCAKDEIGTIVKHSSEPIKVYEFHWKKYRPGIDDQRERAHFITLVYACKVPKDYSLTKQKIAEGGPGYLKWFDEIPEDILPMQQCYRADWNQLKQRIMEEDHNELE